MTKLTSTSIIGAGKKENRQDMDFYPTPAYVTSALLDFLNLPPIVIWEPACGDGAMSDILKKYGHTVISTDIRDTSYSERKLNFLDKTDIECGAIITNPPFNIADKFISKAVQTAPIVAMVLKIQYWNAASRTSLFFRHPPTWILPLTWRPDFLGLGAPTMDVLWTVWLKGDTETKFRPLSKSEQTNLL